MFVFQQFNNQFGTVMTSIPAKNNESTMALSDVIHSLTGHYQAVLVDQWLGCP
jgi:hypothetical protein